MSQRTGHPSHHHDLPEEPEPGIPGWSRQARSPATPGALAGSAVGAAGRAVLTRTPAGAPRTPATVPPPSVVTAPAGAAPHGAAAAAAGTTSAGPASAAPGEMPPAPIPPGRIGHAVTRLDGIAQDLLARTGVPGMAVAVVHRGTVLYAKGFGVRAVGAPQRVDPDTVFQLASVSASVAATVVAAAVGRGIVRWDDRIVDYLPGFALADDYVTRNVTIADMFCHRSGLPGHAGDLLEDLGFEQQEIVHRLRVYPLAPFRAAAAYTGFGLTAAALAVAAAGRTSWESLAEEMLYGPLGLASTSSSHSDFLREANRAVPHARADARWEPRSIRDPHAQVPAEGVSSSARDMARWMLLQLAGGKFHGVQKVARGPLRRAHLPHILATPAAGPATWPAFYGLGFHVSCDASARVQLAQAGGFAGGAASEYRLVPSEELGIVTLTNGMPVGLPESVNASFIELAEVGEVTRDWLETCRPASAAQRAGTAGLPVATPPADPVPPLSPTAYVGPYTSDLYGQAMVSGGGQGLVLSLGPGPQRFTLSHRSGNAFSFEPRGGHTPEMAAVTFTIGAGGQAMALEVESMNGDTPLTAGLGRFTRM